MCETQSMDKLFYITHTDRHGRYWRANNPDPCWQPFQSAAGKYQIEEIVEMLRSVGNEMQDGEKLEIITYTPEA